MDNGLVSIIVPVYNVENYLTKCIDSILGQTYPEIEIILVDDGSTDTSPKICDSYYKKYNNKIKVIHKKNGGLSTARNVGLDNVKGKYIGFVDSDDWCEPTMYEEMINILNKYNCDMVECAVKHVSNNETKISKLINADIMSGQEALKIQLSSVGTGFMPRIAVWSKLYKKEFWKNRRFPEGKIHEDYMLTCEALYEANKIGFINRGLYNHFVSNETSIVNSKFGKKDLYLEIQNELRVKYLADKGEKELANLAKIQYYYTILTLYWKCELNNMQEGEHYLEIIKKNRNEIEALITSRVIWQFRLIWRSPNVYIFIRKAYMQLKSKKII